MTTLEAFHKCLGWQGGTIHQAKQRFAIASLREMDNICGYLLKHVSEISDLEMVQYFTEKRMDAIGLHDIALKN